MDLHNSFIKKNASEIFETNAFDDSVSQVHNVVTPTVEVQPYINIVKSSNTNGASTLYTTPSTYDFYLTNINLTCADDSNGPTLGQITISFTPRGSPTVIYTINGDVAINGNCLTQSILFPMRGVLLEKSSNISLTISGSSYAMIAGYTGSDRS